MSNTVVIKVVTLPGWRLTISLRPGGPVFEYCVTQQAIGPDGSVTWTNDEGWRNRDEALLALVDRLTDICRSNMPRI